MLILPVLINLLIMLSLVGFLVYLKKKKVSFSKRVFAGLGLGILFGLALQNLYADNVAIIKTSNQWFSLIGSGYVKLLQMIVMPLIMVSIISAIVHLKQSKNLGKLSGLIIAVLLLTTALSAGIGIASALGFNLNADQIIQGDAEAARAEYLTTKLDEVSKQSAPQRMLEMLPANPFADMTGARSSSTIAVVIFSALIGLAVLALKKRNPEQAKVFIDGVDALHGVITQLVKMILRLTPYGILAIMTRTVADTSFDAILQMGKFVLASYVALIAVFVLHLVILSLLKLSPAMYLRKILPVLSFAFTSRSSAATLPLTIDAQKNKLGVEEGIANFSSTLGTAIGQNGCAGVYPAMLAVMIAPTVGLDPTAPGFILTLIGIVAISSFGIAGVGGGATFAALIVLSSMGLPVGLAGLLISVEPLIDMGRTAVNVSGSVTSGLVTGTLLKDLDREVYYRDIEDAAELAVANA